MGIDKFINDYLDGSITPEDDKEFRDMLERDPLAKEEFDLMISTHALLKSDAESIRIPEDFQRKVEERILAQYLHIANVNYGSKTRKYAYSALALLLLFVFSIYSISDGKLSSNYSLFWSEIAKQQDLLVSQVPTLDEQWIISQGNIKSPTSSSYFSNNINERNRKNSQRVEILEQSRTMVEAKSESPLVNSSKVVSQSPFLKLNSIAFSTNDFVDKNNLKISSGIIFVRPLNNLFLTRNFQGSSEFDGNSVFPVQIVGKGTLPYTEYPTKGVLLSGFSCLPFAKFGFADVKLKSYSAFSQSFGYKISDNFRLGLEFGYFDFVFEHPTMILVPATIAEAKESKIYSRIDKDKRQEENLLTNGNDFSNSNYVQVVVPIDRKFQIYWGSLFFDYIYPLTEYFSLAGRVNVGATNSGALGKVILFTEFQPIKGLAINLGVENKSYWLTLPSSSSSFKSEFGLVYGVSIKMDFE